MHVTVLSRKQLNENGDDENIIVRVFDSVESCGLYVSARYDDTEQGELAIDIYPVHHVDRQNNVYA